MPKGKKIEKPIVLEEPVLTEKIETDSESDDDKPVQLEKPKRQKTPAQVEAWNKALAIRAENRLKRKDLNEKAKIETDKIMAEQLKIKEEKLAIVKAKKEKKINKMKEKELLVAPIPVDESSDEEVIIKKRVSKKPKVIYVDSDDEEVEKPTKGIVIINKMNNPTNSKPKMVIPERTFRFV
jgi:hypothetical protein